MTQHPDLVTIFGVSNQLTRLRLLLGVPLLAVAFFATVLTSSAQTPRVVGWSFPGVEVQWFAIAADLDADGAEELVVASIDSTAILAVSPPTPIYVLSNRNEKVVDRTLDLFETAPLSWSVRTFLAGDFNGDGQLDLYLCTAGRETADLSLQTTPRTPGVWGEQDMVFFGGSGRLIDRTSTLPQSIDYSHGCSAGDIYKSGRTAVVINDVAGPYAPYRASSAVLEWNGSQFDVRYPFPVFTGTRTGKPFGFYTVTADYDKNGYADVIGDQDVLWGGAAGPASRPLPPNALVTPTFGNMQGNAVADFNADGYPDAVKILSTTPATGLSGARFVLYTGGPTGIVEKLDAFPSIQTYLENDFGLSVSVLDVNFDGFIDLATLGFAYNQTRPRPAQPSPSAVWLNDGTGRFTLARLSDRLTEFSVCGGARGAFHSSFFLKTADPLAYNLIIGGCFPGSAKTVYTSRLVTPASPVVFTR